MTRTRSGSLAAGGLNWASLPLKLFAGGNAKFWDPADIDFTRDRADWEKLSDDERDYATRLCTQFIAGEEAVTEDIQPFMSAMRAEGRLADEMYLTQFAFEEAKHTQVFRMWLDAVGISEDLHRYLDDLPAYRQIFYAELPECLNALSADPSPAAQVRASVTYNHIVEGMLALTGYYAGTRSVWNAQSFPACRSWSGASVTTSDATWLGAPSPVGATSPPTTPIGRCSKHG